MANGIRAVSVARGRDPRDFALIVAGGAGPVHAGPIAKELGIPMIIVPRMSAVFCATGMLISNLHHDFVRTYVRPLTKEEVGIDQVNTLLGEMRTEALQILEREEVPQDRMNLRYSFDLRYEGQFHEVEIPLPLSRDGKFTVEDIPVLIDLINKKHEELYGFSTPESPVEVINLRLAAKGMTEKPKFKETPFKGEDASHALKGKRKVFFDGGFIEVPVYDGEKMGNGNKVSGPVIIEEPTTTIIVTPDYDMVCDRFSNYIMYPKGENMEEISERIRRGK